MIEQEIEQKLIEKLRDLKYTYRSDIRDRTSLESNFRQKFETLNRVHLTDAEFARLRDEIVNADVFQAAKALRENGYMEREDGTPLHYMLVNLKDWCKNEFEVIHQLRINTDNSHHRYDVILLINGLPLVQIELKSVGINPRRAMEQIIEYKRHFSTFKEKVVSYPEKKTGEQQKIADCLSSLDALIAAQADKIEALKTHKKGLMQQLFPRPEAVDA